ncbi:MAG: lysophospholipid acyltransferase family protein, partial [Alphaproteobacteria bacterium]
VLKRLGIFGVEQESPRGAAQFLTVSKGILSRPGTMIWLTPEGHFTDVRCRPVRFQPGLAHLARELERAALLPVAVEYPFWNESKPEVLVRFGTALDSGKARDRAAEAWNGVLAEALGSTMDLLAADAMTRDPGRFKTLLSGRTGVGFFYDTWRRLKAVAQGRRFSAAHEDEPHRGKT